MVLNKKNDRLERVQVGREKEIPFKSESGLWFLVFYKNGSWDADSRLEYFEDELKEDKVNEVFCVWHGKYRTNLFLLSPKFLEKYFKDKQPKKDELIK